MAFVWPKQCTITQLQGIGQLQSPQKGSEELIWRDGEGHEGTFQPCIILHLL